ncbi:lactate 2-monooxygenase [Rhodothermus profundi]|uniref:FMN-dependent dehydrogenase, includes L-lactate dehydrogenase and type II isopentenyl diphosphate isomerase n=1 Tax=Rhodothermus profundi TaxID=633813 RepID=A0A1M6WVV9_9BACT|nr:lactate 2-monooxygenase [Rhodothermus profundi]SHK97912.1 FMN-dependent dehydrogenase, includes L-lactate dehydrogenase and type II isopentenyl diphosphate isomerase [Rhodothermus profundi]
MAQDAFEPAASPGMQRQLQIYLNGLAGERPPFPIAIEALEVRAREVLRPEVAAYLCSGAGGEETVQANREAFRRWQLVPRMLRGVGQRALHIELLGRRLPAPVLLAPIGVQGILHPEGERAVARAAATVGVPFVLSTVSSVSLEAVAEVMGNAPRWFQLYWGRDPELTVSLIQRAEAAGYEALVVTLDTPLLAWRAQDLEHAYLPFLHGEGLANYFSDPVFRRRLDEPPESNPTAAILTFARIFSNPDLTWEDLAFLKKNTRLPILLKGILHPDDARQAAEAGMDGVIVSNHGGRQVDGAIAALDALPAVVEAVGDRLPVLFDSGIRRAADVLKAIALGARAVLLGRPYTWGLAVGGEAGVRFVLENLLAELDLALGLLGCRNWDEVDRTVLHRLED